MDILKQEQNIYMLDYTAIKHKMYGAVYQSVAMTTMRGFNRLIQGFRSLSYKIEVVYLLTRLPYTIVYINL